MKKKKIAGILAVTAVLLAALLLGGQKLLSGAAAGPSAAPTVSPPPSAAPTATPYVPLPPVITLLGDDPLYLPAQPAPYEDPGCAVWDEWDGDLTEQVKVTEDVIPYRAGEGSVTYTVADSEGFFSSTARKVIVTAVPVLETVIPEGRIIYLTFDDGPSGNTDRLLSILDAYGVKATWFVTNLHPEYISLLGTMAGRGHTVAIHSAAHDYQTIYGSEEAFFEDLREMQDIIFTETGIRTTLLRFPGGSSNTVSRFNPGIMTALTKDLTDMGYTWFDWNVTAADTASNASYDTVVANVKEGCSRNAVSVVLQHDTNRFSVEAVEEILRWGQENGYTFLPLEASSFTAHHDVLN